LCCDSCHIGTHFKQVPPKVHCVQRDKEASFLNPATRTFSTKIVSCCICTLLLQYKAYGFDLSNHAHREDLCRRNYICCPTTTDRKQPTSFRRDGLRYRYNTYQSTGRIQVTGSNTISDDNNEESDTSIRTTSLPVFTSNSKNSFSDLLPSPNPTLTALDVVTLCMDTLIQNRHDTKIGLEVCFTFSNDRCRAAIGGNLIDFFQYATNPTFTYLTSCSSYSVIAMGPIILGTTHRGSMQTILIEIIPSISTSMTSSLVSLSNQNRVNNKPLKPPEPTPNDDQVPRRFLWTVQQERRPPFRGCWMIHEVLYTKNAYQQTL
jgi:hypothetical protein